MMRNILFDASRLLSRTERSAPTGIDRVCLAYAEWLIAHPHLRMVPVKSRKGQLVLVDDGWFRGRMKQLRCRWQGEERASLLPREQQLFDTLSQPTRPRDSLVEPHLHPPAAGPVRGRALRQYFRSRRPAVLPDALAYINVGHTGLDEPELLSAVRTSGMARILLVHDLIPVTHPEYCRAGDGPKHERRMRHALTLGTHIITNSAHTADELRRFATLHDLPVLPTTVAHLGLEPHLAVGEPIRTTRPYFIFVGTIEARKNLAFLLTVWRRLEETMGPQTPSLVLAGRHGWENEAVLDLLERSPNLRGLVHQISGLSDRALSSLMRGAHAVIAPSSVEGFDLPAVEAMALGLPLLASDIPPHRELTPQARLIDPIDGPGWLSAIADWTRNPPPHLPPQIRPAPSWAEHFAIVEHQILSPLAGKSAQG